MHFLFLLSLAFSAVQGSQKSQENSHPTLDLFGFHKNLTQLESITQNEAAVGHWLASSLESQGYHVEKQFLQRNPDRFNVYAWPGENRDAKVLVTSHIDTVRGCPCL